MVLKITGGKYSTYESVYGDLQVSGANAVDPDFMVTGSAIIVF